MAFPRFRYDVPQIHAYEIKVSRGDLFSDLNAEKWRKYLEHCQSVTFAMPHGLAKKEEIPTECGVMFRTGRGWRTERRPTNVGSACSTVAMAKLLTCHPDREPYPGLAKYEGDALARKCRDRFEVEVGQRLGRALARLAADIADGKDPAGRAEEKARDLIAKAQREADALKANLAPVFAALGISADLSEWEIARSVRRAAEDLSADSRVARVERALAQARAALADVALTEDA
jgi:hypothetical protein